MTNAALATEEGAGVPGRAIEAPVIWLLGKVQSGKSSIVAALTGAERAAIGSGFRPCTRTAELYPFPAEEPVVSFLDTRGLGEARYDPTEDLVFAETRAHLLCAVMRAADTDQSAVLAVLATVRKRHPNWPVIVAQTCLHELYGDKQSHVLPYPTDASNFPEPVAQALARQRQLFANLPGTGPVLIVAVDFTQRGDGYTPQYYGLDALLDAIAQAAPLGLAASLASARNAATQPTGDGRAGLERTIQRHAMAAAAVDVVPLLGLVGVPGVQAALLKSLADSYAVAWDRRALTELGSALGLGTMAWLAGGLGVRQLVKLIPVYGQTIGAAAAAATSFATTYALGKAAIVYLQRRNGKRTDTDDDDVIAAYRTALKQAISLAGRRA